jgi:cobalt/nickel transport system permease protein
MHIPDGFLDIKTLATTNLISISFLFYVSRRISKLILPERIPLMGIASAFVFTIQLIAFPVISGTSVHLLGSVLISVLLGPGSGFLIISSALILQSILFQHGGLISLGANIFNIGIIGCFLGYLIYRIYPSKILAAISSFLTTIIGAFFCVIELYISQRIDFKVGLVAMLLSHLIIGIIEGAMTFLVLLAIERTRPDLLNLDKI